MLWKGTGAFAILPPQTSSSGWPKEKDVRKVLAVLAAAALAGGAWLTTMKYELRGWDTLRLLPRDGAPSDVPQTAPSPTITRFSASVRVAAFNLQAFNEAKAENHRVVERLAEIIRRFDIVAIQEVDAINLDVLPRLRAQVNTAGRQYDFVASPRLGRTLRQAQYAFLYDTASVEVDRTELYVVNDPDDLLDREPFVAWFRVRGPAPESAFTFSLVNVQVAPELAEQEVDVLADVFNAVRNDGRGEDDVILLGDFHVADDSFNQLNELPGVVWAIAGLPTNTRGDAPCANLVFRQDATNEFTGAVGVFDFMREFNLTLDEALEISDHLPVWAEFTAYEGGQPRRMAAFPPR